MDVLRWPGVIEAGEQDFGPVQTAALAAFDQALDSNEVEDIEDGDDDEADPWHGQTTEWLTASPAPEDNFDELVLVRSAEPAYDAERELEGSDA